MSASLVGSEMCIRDRETTSSGRGRWHNIAAELVGAAQGEGSQVASVGAVSYTHLTLPTICSV
eukprot:9857907-Alexandrium_andersonii.AAC.1